MAGERILIADDEEGVLEVAQLALELSGYQVTTANSGWRAIEHATRSRYHLLLTDIKMPEMDGFELFQRVRQVDAEIIGVVMTGYGTLEMALQALRRGFGDFVPKPFTPDQLADTVARALETERLRRENTRLKALIPLFELSRVFMSEPDLETLLERVVRTGLAETGAARAELMLLNAAQGFEVAAQTGDEGEYGDGWRNVAEYVLRTGKPLVVDANDAGTIPVPEIGLPEGYSVLAAPLFTNKERALGALVLGKPATDEPFAQGDAELLNVLAGQAAVAIENAQLFAEREAAYQELQTLDSLKSEFISIAAHELRTPLSIVLGYAEILETETEGEAREFVGIIVENALRLRGIMDHMTDLRYLEQKQAKLRLSTIALPALIEERRRRAETPHAERAVKVTTEVAAEVSTIVADAEKLGLVLESLLSNAYKFSSPGSTIDIRAEACDDEVVISVRDEGPGIPIAEQPKVWTRFYQVADSLTRHYGGIGVGLAIVKGLVELHGGRVWVESEEGEGSTFSFAIPRKVLEQ